MFKVADLVFLRVVLSGVIMFTSIVKVFLSTFECAADVIRRQHFRDKTIGRIRVKKYSRISMARTLMAHSPGLARTIIMVPTCYFRLNPPGMGGTTLV